MSQEKQTTEKIAITKSELSRLINDQRYKAEDIANHYGITVAQAKRAVKAAGLRFRKFHVDPFVIVDDIQSEAKGEVDAVETEVTEDLKKEVISETKSTPKEEETDSRNLEETAQVTEEVVAKEEVVEVAEVTEEVVGEPVEVTEEVAEEAISDAPATTEETNDDEW